MKINFTKKQFDTLLKMAYISNWIVNAARTGREGDEYITEYVDLKDYIFSFAKEFGLEKYIDEDDGKLFPTRELEEGEAHEFIDNYEEDVFWNEISDRLARRDFFRKYGEEKISQMEIGERIEKTYPFLEKYGDEIEQHGIERLEIQER
ncbi:MAG: hypothetical protein CR972_00310 [Candidatus Moraniibacteriota bacterium]|nr:MAG: hypothetical protein CR972_00310 [Candidatus Moranbacteria bacterium]